ncbi:hypothetical protein BS78_07G133300 [Paspalum vaginatum]|nr:hypothetical protein BS78_07G133300 [Paspalum vaginatum]
MNLEAFQFQETSFRCYNLNPSSERESVCARFKNQRSCCYLLVQWICEKHVILVLAESSNIKPSEIPATRLICHIQPISTREGKCTG